MTKVLSIMNPKGGVGKSTVTRLLCGYFLDQKTKFKIIDMGSQLTSYKLASREVDPRMKNRIIPLVTDNEDTFLGTMSQLESEDLIIIDSNANISSEEINMIASVSDLIVVPVVASMGDLDATLGFARFMWKAKEHGVKVRTLINKFDGTLENREVRNVCETDLKLKCLNGVLNDKPAEYRRWQFSTSPDVTIRHLSKEIENILNE